MSEPSLPSDSNLARYCASGDPGAFRAVVDGHLAMVQATAVRRLGEYRHLAADVAQAVFTRLAQVAPALPPGMVIAAWLHRQTVRRSLDVVRTETRRRVRETRAAFLLQPEPGAGAGSGEDWAWDLAPLLDEALDRLSEADRAALVLRYLEDRDLPAVAARLNTTPEAARKRVARSLARLRGLLARRGVAVPGNAALAVSLTRTHALAVSLRTADGARAGLSASAISREALTACAQAGGPGAGISLFTTFIMNHLASAGAGALLVLTTAGFFTGSRKARPGAASRPLPAPQRHPPLPPLPQRRGIRWRRPVRRPPPGNPARCRRLLPP